ncbi:acyl-CoA dehydrogenase family protein [Chitinophaga qingshengii]|uniref:Acyl-CoA dehydrogenase family protein n=1 Tax=Chitinophaga qingshengii TaxID=1569794 RepID=A0ABR7TF17_9BACT|nr:acyl-CoA dehydrogenase family protein [Chitinophaga qingshengii]MBC9928891.1 acyl-CoA dehydrogenase family protein [Chitinophaga qingshengii]
MPGFDFEHVSNQVPVLENYNTFTTHPLLQNSLQVYGGGQFTPLATALGQLMGSRAFLEAGILANTCLPVLHTHDRFGNRLDTVSYHPAYHQMMSAAIEHQVHSIAWTAEKDGYLVHSVLSYLKQQIDEGSSCPLTMTFAVVPSLQLAPDIAREWLPLVLSNTYDERHIPYYEKKGVTFGMAMTEPQGGSDVRANITQAHPAGNGVYHITGRKWFCSAPMSDAFLVLAQAPKGLSCFLMPRFTPDGAPNKLRFQRLKDKLGNRSNASGEVEFHGAWAQLIGEEGRGIANIMEMVRHTRLDCAVGSAATLQRALAEAIHHCRHRHTFGQSLMRHPLMQNVLTDLALESAAATTLAMRLAKGFDDARTDATALHFTRIATAVGKFWNTKRAVLAMGEILECLGGNGYVETSILPRLYRDVPVNAIWEGSGNIQSLDVLRAMHKEPASMEALMQYFLAGKGLHPLLNKHVEGLRQLLSSPADLERKARLIVEKMALAMQAIELIQTASPAVAELFCRARLGVDRSLTWGGLSEMQGWEDVVAAVYSGD